MIISVAKAVAILGFGTWFKLAVGASVVLAGEPPAAPRPAHASNENKTPSAESLIARMAKYRRASIKSGRVVVHTVNTSHVGQQSEHRYRITFDQDHIRYDRESRAVGGTLWGRPTRIAINDDEFIESDPPVTIQMGVIEKDKPFDNSPAYHASNAGRLSFVVHPRLLGMRIGATGSLHSSQQSIESALEWPHLRGSTVAKDKLLGRETWRIDLHYRTGSHVSLWLSPNQGYSMIQARVESKADTPTAPTIVAVVSSTVKKNADDVWYPRRVFYQVSINGHIIDHQTTTVEEARFNDHVDPALFTLAGFDLRDGQRINDNRAGKNQLMIWEDGRLRRGTINDLNPRRHFTVSRKDRLRREGDAKRRVALDKMEDLVPPDIHVTKWLNASDKGQVLKKLKGKVVLIEFWGTWCAPCVRSIPTLNALLQKHKARGLVILGIHTSQPSVDLNKFLQQHGVHWPVGVDVDNKSAKAFGVASYPGYYLIDRSGKLRMADLFNEDLEKAIIRLLDEVK